MAPVRLTPSPVTARQFRAYFELASYSQVGKTGSTTPVAPIQGVRPSVDDPLATFCLAPPLYFAG